MVLIVSLNIYVWVWCTFNSFVAWCTLWYNDFWIKNLDCLMLRRNFCFFIFRKCYISSKLGLYDSRKKNSCSEIHDLIAKWHVTIGTYYRKFWLRNKIELDLFVMFKIMKMSITIVDLDLKWCLKVFIFYIMPNCFAYLFIYLFIYLVSCLNKFGVRIFLGSTYGCCN